jgi:ribosomal-protein-alanine N-acetyltransferase
VALKVLALGLWLLALSFFSTAASAADRGSIDEIDLIRPATSADIASFMELERLSPTAAHWTERQYHEMFDQGESQRFILAAESSTRSDPKGSSNVPHRLLGFLVARHLAPEWELENIVVAPAVRRNGIGNQLLSALLAAARKAKSEPIFLEVRDSNTAARALYEKAGFVQTGRRKSYYANPAEDAVLYRLRLL